LHQNPQVQRRTRWIPAITGTALLALFAEVSGNVFDPAFLRHVSHDLQFVMFAAGSGCWHGGSGATRSTLLQKLDTEIELRKHEDSDGWKQHRNEALPS
jgi:hypothetical protein